MHLQNYDHDTAYSIKLGFSVLFCGFVLQNPVHWPTDKPTPYKLMSQFNNWESNYNLLKKVEICHLEY